MDNYAEMQAALGIADNDSLLTEMYMDTDEQAQGSKQKNELGNRRDYEQCFWECSYAPVGPMEARIDWEKAAHHAASSLLLNGERIIGCFDLQSGETFHFPRERTLLIGDLEERINDEVLIVTWCISSWYTRAGKRLPHL